MSRRTNIQRALTAALLGATLTACGAPVLSGAPTTNTTPTRQPAASPAASASPVASAVPSASPGTASPAPTAVVVPTPVDAQPVANPVIGFEPKAGAPGTRVAVWGAGATPGAPVVVRLGLPQAIGEVLASAVADGKGSWKAELVIPDRLPSGEVISGGNVRLVAMNEQNVALASAPFGFTAPASAAPSRDAAVMVVDQLLSNFGSGNIAPYVAKSVRDAMAAGRPAHQVLGLAPMAWQYHAVYSPEDRPSEVLFVPATLTFATYEEDRVFELVVEGGQWKVQGSSQRSVREIREGGDPTAGYMIAATDDWNGDGVKDVLYFKQTTVVPQASFSDEALNARTLTVSETWIGTSDAAGVLNMFSVNSEQIRAGQQAMAWDTYGSPGRPAAFLLAFDLSGTTLLSILPLNADGSAHDEVIDVNWRADLNAYVFEQSLRQQ